MFPSVVGARHRRSPRSSPSSGATTRPSSPGPPSWSTGARPPTEGGPTADPGWPARLASAVLVSAVLVRPAPSVVDGDVGGEALHRDLRLGRRVELDVLEVLDRVELVARRAVVEVALVDGELGPVGQPQERLPLDQVAPVRALAEVVGKALPGDVAARREPLRDHLEGHGVPGPLGPL